MRKVLGLATAAVLAIMAGNAVAAEIEVKMLNKGAEGVMVFEPALVKIAPGDTSGSSPPTRAITQRASRACCRPTRRRSSARTAKTSR